MGEKQRVGYELWRRSKITVPTLFNRPQQKADSERNLPFILRKTHWPFSLVLLRLRIQIIVPKNIKKYVKVLH